jgi:hypothetical protein
MRNLCHITIGSLLVAALFGCQPDKTGEILFVCNGKALDKEAALQRHTDELIPITAQAADVAAADDACMWAKGYAFTGDNDPKYCGESRIPQCYSRR